jgi:hypothetical protein
MLHLLGATLLITPNPPAAANTNTGKIPQAIGTWTISPKSQVSLIFQNNMLTMKYRKGKRDDIGKAAEVKTTEHRY